jgi:tetratricopeptide (TPR) repeat protein
VAHDEELHREIALKEIQDRYADDPESRSRFVLEAEVTGGLEHPGIVPVYGLGAYPDGRPFYAMRFIRGDSLKEAIDCFHQAEACLDPGQRALGLRQLLGRFVDMCNAVAYAHSRGVLHRDLKPANVMLGPYGETLVVDWGLSKPLGKTESKVAWKERPLVPVAGGSSAPTQMGQALGTPAYMSPEQAAGQLDQLGPASDVYSLGATLYCLLTGQAPFTDADLGLVLKNVSKGTFRAPGQVKRGVAPALEAVCLKAMALKPEDRYASARALADDIEHWLADEPVSAYREPLPARLARWGRRHKTWVASSAALLVTALVALTIGLVAVGQANSRTREQRNLAQRNADRAQRNADQAEAINHFLVNDLLGEAAPEQNPVGQQITVVAALEKASRKIGTAFKEQPEIEASLRLTIGNALRSLGRFEDAEPHLQTALELHRRLGGQDHPDALKAQHELARLLMSKGNYSDAESLLKENLEASRRVLGPDDPFTLRTLNSLAVYHQWRNELAEAERLHGEVLEARLRVLGPDHEDTLHSLSNLGGRLLARRQYQRAVTVLRDALAGWRRRSGEDNPTTLTVRFNLAKALWGDGNRDQAERLCSEVWEARRRVSGLEHKDTLVVLETLVRFRCERAEAAKAEKLLCETLAELRKPPAPRQATIAALQRLLAECRHGAEK